MVIRRVDPDSPAAALGIHVGEDLVSINGNRIRDILDYHFYVADGDLEIVLGPGTGGDARRLHVQMEPGQDLGVDLDSMKIRLCGNECVFCFIDQVPKGMRPTLYVKDEDYRLSFLHGNFVTLTNMKDSEIQRIIDQRLSPMYVSVHSTNPETRQRLLRPRRDCNILAVMDRLIEGGITLHTQIVLCPGFNDGADLEATIEDLAARWPGIRSLAAVPLGLTDHRDDLVPVLDPFTVSHARLLLEQALPRQRRFRRGFGATFLYLADEIYRLLGIDPPPASQYDGYPQIENGIGMTRHFLSRLRRAHSLFPQALERGDRRVTLVTGKLFEPILRPAIEEKLARTREALTTQIVGCENRFFGSGVTVAGLLTGSDIVHGLEGKDLGDRVYVPPATLNDDGLFLDDLRLADLEKRFGVPFEPGIFRT